MRRREGRKENTQEVKAGVKGILFGDRHYRQAVRCIDSPGHTLGGAEDPFYLPNHATLLCFTHKI